MDNICRLALRFGRPLRRPQLIEAVLGQHNNAQSTAWKLQVCDPGTGELLYTLPETTPTEIDEILTLTKQCTKSTFSTDHQFRQLAMQKWAELVQAHSNDIAVVLSLEGGKVYGEAEAELESVYGTIRSFSDYLQTRPDFLHSATKKGRAQIRHVPLGTHYCVTPWNFPAAMVSRKVCPPLAAGCPVIVKPDHRTPLTAMILIYLAQMAGFPRSACPPPIITSDPQSCTEQVLRDPSFVQRVTFTGSTAVGLSIARQAGVRSCGLELGGSAPFIVHHTADLTRAVDDLISSRFRHSGQTCICANRAIVHRSIFPTFDTLLRQKIDQLYNGNMPYQHQLSTGCRLGPLIDESAVERLQGEIGGRDNSTIWQPQPTQPTSPPPRNTITPTIIYESQEGHTKHELFGPILRLVPFDTHQEAIDMASSPHGLAAYIYSHSPTFSESLKGALQTGMLGINTVDIVHPQWPFGGCLQSGHGTEGMPEVSILESMRIQLTVSHL